MRKIWLVGLLIMGTPVLFGMVVEQTASQCYRICVSDGYSTACGISCDDITITYDDGTTGNLGGNFGDGGGGPFSVPNQDMVPCWTDLTTSKRVTSYFDEVRTTGTCGFHTGVDIGTAAEGGKIPLYSGTSGTVKYIRYDEHAGFHVIVRNDNGSYTVYSHLDGDTTTGAFNNTGNIAVGTRVTVGMRLGTTDSSGNLDPHLDIKTYVVGNASAFLVSIQFGISLDSSDIHYCSAVNRTYINSLTLMGGKDCR